MYLTYRNISVGEMGPEISGKQKSTPKPKRKFILGHPVVVVDPIILTFVIIILVEEST